MFILGESALKGKTFLANRYYLFEFVLGYSPLFILFTIGIINGAWLTLGGRLILFIIIVILYSIFCVTFLLIPGTATMRFYEEYFKYKKSLFAKPILFPYSEITKLFVDFGDNSPLPKYERRKMLLVRRCYIFSGREVVCCFCMNRNILKESLKHVGKGKVKVYIPSDKYSKKRYYPILEDYLTEKQKREMKGK